MVYLRKGETFAEIAAGFGIGTATAWRYVRETVALLAKHSPTLDQALRTAKRAGYAFVVLDGTLIPIDRVAADRPYYSGKHKMHGMNIQVLAAPDGTPLWTSGSLPGSVHDLKAARIWGIIRRLHACRTHRPRRQGIRRCRSHACWCRTRARQTPVTKDGQLHPRQAPRPRRASQCRAENLAHPAETPMLPSSRRPARQRRSSPFKCAKQDEKRSLLLVKRLLRR